MKRFKVTASYITYLSTEIEAESYDEACELARELDGGDFESNGGDDWNLDDVMEINDEN